MVNSAKSGPSPADLDFAHERVADVSGLADAGHAVHVFHAVDCDLQEIGGAEAVVLLLGLGLLDGGRKR